MRDTLREAAQLLAVELTVEIANAPAPNYEEDDYAAGYVAGLAFALEKLDTILAAHPAGGETEWGVQGPSGNVVRHSSEGSARSVADRRNYGLVARQSATPWQVSK